MKKILLAALMTSLAGTAMAGSISVYNEGNYGAVVKYYDYGYDGLQPASERIVNLRDGQMVTVKNQTTTSKPVYVRVDLPGYGWNEYGLPPKHSPVHFDITTYGSWLLPEIRVEQ